MELGDIGEASVPPFTQGTLAFSKSFLGQNKQLIRDAFGGFIGTPRRHSSSAPRNMPSPPMTTIPSGPIFVDTMGNLLAVVVHTANIHDTKAGILAAKTAYESYPSTKSCENADYRG